MYNQVVCVGVCGGGGGGGGHPSDSVGSAITQPCVCVYMCRGGLGLAP